MHINIVITNKYGTYTSPLMNIEEEEYANLIEVSKMFHLDNTFDMALELGGHVIIPPNIISESIMTINIKNYDE